MSRHEPHTKQVEALRVMFGQDVLIEQESRPFDDARQIGNRYRRGRYDDMVIVAPLSVIAVLCGERINPLWSESVEEDDPSKIDYRGARNQGFRFVRFRRIIRVALEFAD